jgi:dipeptidase D
MEGANGIDLSMLKGHAMLNVDSEDEGVFTTSCAGGVSVHVTLPLDREDLSDDVSLVELSVSGLVGGHSGCEIDKGRANANKILGRALYELSEKVDFCIVKLWGGKKDNAIPIQANAIIGLSEDNAIKTLEDFLEKLNQELKKEYLKVDENITLFSKRIANIKSDTMSKAFTESSRDKIITYLMCVPNGIQNMSMSVPGLVETSLNLGILETKENHLFAQHSVRSSVSTRKEYVVKQLQSLAIALGGKVECKGDYPAWEYREDSKVRDRAVLLWKQMYGKEPVVEGIHAGLECGLLAAKIKNLDCISIGPDMNDIHTYNERLSISSTKRVYDFIVEFLNV